jgi:K+-transporting ATPase ATPase B chain
VAYPTERKPTPLWEPNIVKRACIDAFGKLDPRLQARNPVMFVVEVTALAVTAILAQNFFGGRSAPLGFELQIALWLWFTVLFANFAEAMAEGRGKAQADNLRKTRTETQATLLREGQEISVAATSLRRGDVVMVRAGDRGRRRGERGGGHR